MTANDAPIRLHVGSTMTDAQLAAYRAGQTCAAFANIRLATDKEIARRKGVETYEWPVRRAG